MWYLTAVKAERTHKPNPPPPLRPPFTEITPLKNSVNGRDRGSRSGHDDSTDIKKKGTIIPASSSCLPSLFVCFFLSFPHRFCLLPFWLRHFHSFIPPSLSFSSLPPPSFPSHIHFCLPSGWLESRQTREQRQGRPINPLTHHLTHPVPCGAIEEEEKVFVCFLAGNRLR